jgi:hypothetical protein
MSARAKKVAPTLDVGALDAALNRLGVSLGVLEFACRGSEGERGSGEVLAFAVSRVQDELDDIRATLREAKRRA